MISIFPFFSLHELLRHEHNGLIFNDHKELAEQLQVLLASIYGHAVRVNEVFTIQVFYILVYLTFSWAESSPHVKQWVG